MKSVHARAMLDLCADGFNFRVMDTNGKRPRRPADMNQLANLVGRIATGEVEEDVETPEGEQARKRGEARSAKLSPEERSEIAKKAASARWKK